MSYSLVELKPNEKLHLELNEGITLNDLAEKLKGNIHLIHVYQDGEYKKINIFRDGSTDAADFQLEETTKVILENTDKDIKFLLDINFNVCEMTKIAKKDKVELKLPEFEEKEKEKEKLKNVEVNKIEQDKLSDDESDVLSKFLRPNIKANEFKHWSAESVKTINIPYEKQSSINLKFKEMGILEKEIPNDSFLSLIEECSATSSTGNISFRFFFMEGKNYLKVFHYQMFLILKRFMEKLITGHNQFNGNHYLLDIFVFASQMKDTQLGSAMIHKYVKNDDNNLILPTKAIMKLNYKLLAKKVNDKINVRLMQTLFHELVHCLGFGYWDLFGKNMCYHKYLKNEGVDAISADNVLNIDKSTAFYKVLYKNNTIMGVPMTDERTHFNIFNVPITKNGKLFSILPGLKYELMSNNETEVNVFTRISGSILEALGYHINYKLCDEYPFTILPDTLTVEYTKATNNHFAYGFEKYIMLLKHKKTLLSGIETFAMKEKKEYRIKNTHSYSLFVVSALEENESYLLGEKEGVSYINDELVICPNSRTPGLFFIVSSITFGGIPIVKLQPLNNINFDNCYNHLSLKKLVDEFVNGKSPRID